jgi:hypothetical protein
MARAMLALFALAVVTLVVGVEVLDAPRVTAAGALLLGATALLAGIDALRTGRVFFQASGAQALRLRSEAYRGIAARLWGVFFVLAGLLTMLGGAMAIASPERAYATVTNVLDTNAGWGALLAVWGVFVALYGLTRLLGGGGVTVRGTALRLRHWGYRLFGLVCFAGGLLCVTLGILIATSPETLTRWARLLAPILG